MLTVIKHTSRKLIRYFGYDVVSTRDARPILSGCPKILGSYPPWEQWFGIGDSDTFYIQKHYVHRKQVAYFDDTSHIGEWQTEVYRFAREVCEQKGFTNVCDLGCGSGEKFMKYFSDKKTVGVDLPATCDYLRKRWPTRSWIEADLERDFPPIPLDPVEMVIAADIIEHLLDPIRLLTYILKMSPAYVVISTPERNLLRNGCHNGPPANPSHVREWTFAEFHAFIGSVFEIEAHFISFAAQATQCVLCRPRRSGPG